MKRWWCGIGLMLAAVAGAETLVSDGVSLMESQGRWTQWRTGNGAVYDFTGYAGVYAAEIREAGGGGAAGGTTIADPRRPASEQVFGQMVSDPSFEYGGRGWNIGSHWSLDESVSHSGKGSLKVSLPDTPTISGNVEIHFVKRFGSADYHPVVSEEQTAHRGNQANEIDKAFVKSFHLVFYGFSYTFLASCLLPLQRYAHATT